MDPSSPQQPDSSPLLDHLETLYPLACTLVGTEEAPFLLRRMAENAVETPTTDPPTDVNEWLQLLLRAARDDQDFADASFQSSPEGPAESTDDWHREAAEQILEAALPIALARCSPQERFLLALDGMDAISPSFQAKPLGDAVPPTGTDVQDKLRGILADILSETEYELIDEALSEEAVQNAIANLLATRYPSVPRSLRSQLRETVHVSSVPEEETSSSEESRSLLERLPSRPNPQTLLFVLLIGVLVLAGGIGVSYYTGSSSASTASSRSLVAFSTEQAGSIEPTLETNSRSEAAAFVDSAWNRRVTVPGIDGADLKGVGKLRTTGDTEIPVLLHGDGDTRFTTFVYSYALLSHIESQATLDPELRNALGTAHHVVNTEGTSPAPALLWRDRDDIFVTVAPTLSPDSLRARLRPEG